MRRTTEDLKAIVARIRAEGPLAASKAAKLIPTSSGKTASASTVVRWIITGKRGVRLDGARLSGKTWWTSEAALERFWAALAQREEMSREAALELSALSPIQREARGMAAGRELERMCGRR